MSLNHPQIRKRRSRAVTIAGIMALAACAVSAASTDRPALAITAASSHTAARLVAARAVTIRNFAFRPHIVTVKPGETVRWTSNTGAFRSPVLQPGASFSIRFTS